MYLCILYREYYYYRINKKDKGEERERDYYVTIILQMDRVTLNHRLTNFFWKQINSLFTFPRVSLLPFFLLLEHNTRFKDFLEISRILLKLPTIMSPCDIRIIATKKLVEPSNSSHTHDLRVRSHTVSFTNIVSFLKRVDTINISFVRLCRDSTRLYN